MAHPPRNGNGLIAIAELPDTTPAREPEVWDERIPQFNPRFARQPEPEPLAVSPLFAAAGFDVETYLRAERAKDLFRFSTAGSVDDGKSTLIGRLLYDTQSIYDDQIRAIEGKGTTAPGVLDLALLTDGLRAEREQGITIDVAYRYFSTSRRKFIIADTPGHEQYTRNMATGASTADAAIVLIDARKGVLPQSRRHAYIAALLGIRHILVAVNKMDLVSYAEPVFTEIREAFTRFFAKLDIPGRESTQLHFVPVSALNGDNVVHATTAMPWYTGPTLLDLLESLPALEAAAASPFRFAVQRVVRPDLDFRGFSGQIASGVIRPGDTVLALPSGRSSRIERIVTYDGDLAEAAAPLSVTLTLNEEIDLSRGDMLVAVDAPATVTTDFMASIVWMDGAPMEVGKRYLLKHGSRTLGAQVTRVLGRVDLRAEASASVHQGSSMTLSMNDIGVVAMQTLLPLAADAYAENRHTGCFVLIDPQTNATAAAGMIRECVPSAEGRAVHEQAEPVQASERIARFGHRGDHLRLTTDVAFAYTLERALFQRGANVAVEEERSVQALVRAGLLAITVDPSTLESADTNQPAIVVASTGQNLHLPPDPEGQNQAIANVLRWLQDIGVLRRGVSS